MRLLLGLCFTRFSNDCLLLGEATINVSCNRCAAFLSSLAKVYGYTDSTEKRGGAGREEGGGSAMGHDGGR